MLSKGQRLLETVRHFSRINEAHILWFEHELWKSFSSFYLVRRKFADASSSLLQLLDIEKTKLASLIPKDPVNENSPSEPLLHRHYSAVRNVAEIYRKLAAVELMRESSKDNTRADYMAASKFYKEAVEVIKSALEIPLGDDEKNDIGKQLLKLRQFLALKMAVCQAGVAKCRVLLDRLEKAEEDYEKALRQFHDKDRKDHILAGKRCKTYHILTDEFVRLQIRLNKENVV